MATTPLSAASSLVEAEDLLDPAENEELDKAVLSELPPEFRVRPPEPTNAYVPAFALSFIASNSKGTIDRRLRYIGEGYTLFQQNPELLDLLWSSVENKSFRQFRNLGKLTQLLADYAQKQEPAKLVVYFDEWKDPSSKLSWWNWLKTTMPWWTDSSFLIVDEGQNTYQDQMFWHSYLRELSDVSEARVIVFSTYASPRAPPPDYKSWHFGRFMVFPRQCVSLLGVPGEGGRHDDGLPRVGLLLTPEEFNDLVQLHHPDRFDRSLLDVISGVTSGYISAVVDLLLIASQSNVSPESLITLDDFMQHHPLCDLIGTFLGNESSAFARGLPSSDDLTDPSVAHVFRTVLENHSVERANFSESLGKTLKAYFERGWLPNAEHESEDPDRDLYFFASPLHRTVVEYVLCDSNQNLIADRSLVDLAMAVCRQMNFGDLSSSDDPLGPAGIRRSPKSRHADEFYRKCSSYAGGGIISSEFALGEGQLYIYIPLRKWGIAVVVDVEDGSGCCERFSPNGLYGQWISGGKMAESAVLNFCSRVSAEPFQHSGNTRFYQVVTSLEDGHNNVRLVDSQLNDVDAFNLAK